MAISPVYHVALDIDDFLAFRQSKPSEKLVDFIQNEGAIIDAYRTYYILPGVKEFIQLLFQTDNLKVSFFSAGLKIRNDLFVDKLLQASLGKEAYENLKDRVSIFSQEDLTERSRSENYGLQAGKYQKDLKKVASDAQALANTILIENDESYVAERQVKNFLFACDSNAMPFEWIKYRHQFYDPDGSRFLKIQFEDISNEYVREDARNKNCIGVLINDQYETPISIGFVDRASHEYREVPLDDLELLDKISSSYYNGRKIKDSTPELLDKIRSFVESRGGKIRKIWRAPNRIYYVAGLFFTALSSAKQNGISLSEALFRIYSKERGNSGSYVDALERLCKNDELYWRGLELLRSINPNLRLTTPQSYLGV